MACALATLTGYLEDALIERAQHAEPDTGPPVGPRTVRWN
jgi:hypothetical protein